MNLNSFDIVTMCIEWTLISYEALESNNTLVALKFILCTSGDIRGVCFSLRRSGSPEFTYMLIPCIRAGRV